MTKAKKEIVQPKPSMHVVMRASARIARMPEQMRAGYIERAKAETGGKHPTRNAAAVLVATGA